MKQNSENYRSHCPINFLLETLGDKWTLLIVRDMMFKGKKRYGEFLESDENIATNILASRLKQLEDNGVITKAVDPKKKSQRLYALTEKGRDLLPMMLEITIWSTRHDSLTNTPMPFVQRLQKNKAPVMAEILTALD